MHTFIIDATLLALSHSRHVSAIKGSSSRNTTDTLQQPEQGQQIELPDHNSVWRAAGFLLNFVPHLEEIGGWKTRVSFNVNIVWWP
jgi:hypothetical protein